MIAGYQRAVSPEGNSVWRWKSHKIGSVQMRLALALAPAISGYPHRLTGSLIFFSSSLFLAVFFPFPSRPRNAHDFLSVFSSPSLHTSRVDLTVDHAPVVSDSAFLFVSSQPLHDRPLPLWISILSLVHEFQFRSFPSFILSRPLLEPCVQ